MPWLKWDNQARRDRKLRRLTPSGRCLWLALCEIGSDLQSEEVCVVPGVAYTNEELADEAGIPVEEVEAALQMMAQLKMIERRPDCILVINLRKRQGWDGDNSTERTREYRKRKKAAGDGNVTGGDGEVTDGDGSGDGDVTGLDKDIDKDTEKPAGRPRVTPPQTWREALEQFAGRPLSPKEIEDMAAVQQSHGQDDELVIAVIASVKEKAKQRSLHRPMIIVRNDLADLGIAGVRTVADWDAHKKARTQQPQRPAPTSGRNPLPKPAARPIDEFTDEDFQEGA